MENPTKKELNNLTIDGILKMLQNLITITGQLTRRIEVLEQSKPAIESDLMKMQGFPNQLLSKYQIKD